LEDYAEEIISLVDERRDLTLEEIVAVMQHWIWGSPWPCFDF
jgi:hypothetical protein